MTTRQRGPDPRDAELFGPVSLQPLRQATSDLSWLLSRGYAGVSALKVVGDRYQLTRRQRSAVVRAACSDTALEARRVREVPLSALAGQSVLVDGFNVLITLERAMSGGVVFIGRDGAVRDLAGVHGSYRAVRQTPAAIDAVARALDGVAEVTWLLDQPVSNSGRLAATLREAALAGQWPWTVETHPQPDPVLAGADCAVVTSDAWILERCHRWCNVVRGVVDDLGSRAGVVDLRTALS